jgi:hypothetical protein
MPKKAKKAEKKPDAHFAAFRVEWERRRKAPDRGTEWLVEKPRLPVEPMPFLRTLRQIGHLTQDRRYIDLHQHLMGSDLIDRATGRWSFHGTKIARVLPELIEEAIADGFTEREAIAEAVAVFELYPDAASFDAAWKRLERLLHEWRKKALDKNRPKKVVTTQVVLDSSRKAQGFGEV